jgi:RNA polymerase sigma-70 factor (ECF subfamily)
MKSEEQKLLDLIKTDEGEGIKQAINIYGPAVKTICRNILRDYGNEAIEEAMQESFIKLWKSVINDKIVTDTLRGYIYSIARNTSIDLIRKKKRYHGFCFDTYEIYDDMDAQGYFSGDLEEELSRKQSEEILHDVVRGMSEPDKTIFILRFFYFYKINEIAQRLTLNEDNVESRLRRGLSKLKDKLIERGVMYE